MDEDEDRLIQAALRGEEYASAFLVSMYGPSLLGHARAVAPDLGDADREHIVCIALERAFRKIDKYDQSKGPLLPWLRAFVSFAVKDWRRDHARLTELDAARDLGPSVPTRSELNRQNALVDLVQECLTKLSRSDRVMIELRDFLQLGVSEVARTLEISEVACRQRHLRARRRLRALLEAHPDSRDLIGRQDD